MSVEISQPTTRQKHSHRARQDNLERPEVQGAADWYRLGITDAEAQTWHDLTELTALLLAWKALILAVAFVPGPEYDTSASLFLGESARLIRWDALYFTSNAQRGHLHEHEWAFSWAHAKLVRWLTLSYWRDSSALHIATTGICISHAAHLLSVILLYFLCRLITAPSWCTRNARYVAALHVIAPAGIFLSAPYTESSFSALNILGYILYAYSLKERRALNNVAVVFSGGVFGIASMFRSNGLLNGIMFAAELLQILYAGRSKRQLRHGLAVIIGGSLIAIGFVAPQILAFREYCAGNATQPERLWCTNMLPSIYSFVQGHYWNNGFLRYWTVSNLPLFLLAAPMLALLLVSAYDALMAEASQAEQEIASGGKEHGTLYIAHSHRKACLRRFVLPQLVLTILALTHFHVQIITRLASGYVLPYLWLTKAISDRREVRILGTTWAIGPWVVRWMVIYGLVQAGLYASFLPPA